MVGSMDTGQVRCRYDEMAGNWRLLGIVDSLLLINRLRKNHFHAARGAVLDVACGTGENFPYLGNATSITALDLSWEMVEEARRRRRQLGIDVELLSGDAQELPFPDRSFDSVVSALSTCTFPDYVKAFGEMGRVVRPGGQILLLEHGRSEVGWIARRQDRHIDRVYARSACRNNRDVSAELAEAGLVPDSHVKSHLGAMNRITIRL
jgi:ubiquinone/menaquinone biosynthesis C-methylase UbiE